MGDHWVSVISDEYLIELLDFICKGETPKTNVQCLQSSSAKFAQILGILLITHEHITDKKKTDALFGTAYYTDQISFYLDVCGDDLFLDLVSLLFEKCTEDLWNDGDNQESVLDKFGDITCLEYHILFGLFLVSDATGNIPYVEVKDFFTYLKENVKALEPKLLFFLFLCLEKRKMLKRVRTPKNIPSASLEPKENCFSP